MIALLWNKLSPRFQHLLYTTQWYLLYRSGAGVSSQLASFETLQPPHGALWADPFPVVSGARQYVFFEELRYRFWGRSTGSCGTLRGIEFLGADRWGKSFPVLERSYHLSYPFVFQFGDRHYMIPESADNRTVDLYQAQKFPSGWTLHRTLLQDLEAFDSTLCQHNGKWWMFTCIRNPADGIANRDLHLFVTEDPVNGEWRAHPANPIVSNLRFARPAGRIFSRNGGLYRPAQDCSTNYGTAIELRKITCLDESTYAEEPAGRITSDGLAGAGGVHTWNEMDGLAVADAQRIVGRWNLC